MAEIVSVSHFGQDALNIVYRADGKVHERLLFRGEEAALTLQEPGRAFGFDAEAGRYEGLTYAKAAPAILPASALLVRKSVYDQQVPQPAEASAPASPGPSDSPEGAPAAPSAQPTPPAKPKRFYGSVDLDPLRPIKSLEAVIDAGVMQLQHSGGAKVRLTLDIEAETERGFDDADIGVVRDNCQQLKFKSDSTGFE